MWQKLFITATLAVSFNHAFASELFRSEFENGLLKYVSYKNTHPGGGYVSFMGGEVNSTYYTPSDGCGDLSVQDVNIDNSQDARGGPADAQTMALKTRYRKGATCGSSFQKNTTIIKFPKTQNIYARWYQKWSSEWIWPRIQQKFCKIGNQDKTSSQNFYFQGSGQMRVNYVSQGKQTTSFDPDNDDYKAINSAVTMSLNKWHEIQVHVKMSDPGLSNGVLEYWIDGVQRFGLYNIENNNGSKDYLDFIELQHIYDTGNVEENGGPLRDMPTWMKNIVVSTTFISTGKDLASPNPPIVN